MDDNRKIAVAFGSFACVVEGYEHPFKVVRRLVKIFEDQAEKNPSFGGFDEIPDADALRERLEGLFPGEGMEIAAMPGGVHVRRLLETDTPLAGAAPDADAVAAIGVAAAQAPRPPASEPAGFPQAGGDTPEPAPDPVALGEAGDPSDHNTTLPAEIEEAAEQFVASAQYDPTPDHTDVEIQAGLGEPKLEDLGQDPGAEDAQTPASDDALLDAALDAFDGGAFGAKADDFASLDVAGDLPNPDDVKGFAADLSADLGEEAPDLAESALELFEAAVSDLSFDQDDVPEQTHEQVTSKATEPLVLTSTTPDRPAPDLEADNIVGDVPAQDLADAPEGATDEDAASEEALGDAAESSDDVSIEDAIGAALGKTPDAEPAAAPLRLGEGPSEPAPLRLTPEPAPMRLGEDAPAASGAGADGFTEPTPQRRPLFGRKAIEDREAAAEAAQDGPASKPAALRLSAEMAPPNQENSPSFVDAMSAPPVPEEAEHIPEVPVIADTPDLPSPSEGGADAPRKARGLGGFLRRKPAAGDEAQPEAEAPGVAPRLVLSAEADGDAAAEENRQAAASSVLRVVSGDEDAAKAAAEEAAKPARGGLRSFLRAKPDEAEAPGPISEPAPVAETPAQKPATDEATEAVKGRLHASFAKAPDPVSTDAIELEAPDAEEIDAYTPLGFAHHAGAKSLPELMTAATAYLSIVEGRSAVSRAEILEVVQQIAGDTPLTAEAKVKAVGKLVRSGTLMRLDGGVFMLDESAAQAYRNRLDGAA